MIDNGPLKPKKKKGSLLGSFQAGGKYGNTNATLNSKKPLPVLNRPKRTPLMTGKNLSGAVAGLSTGANPAAPAAQRQAAVNAEIARLRGKPLKRKEDKGHLSKLLAEASKGGYYKNQ